MESSRFHGEVNSVRTPTSPQRVARGFHQSLVDFAIRSAVVSTARASSISGRISGSGWKGWIVGYEQSGNGLNWQWNFLVINAKNEAALDQGETTITVTVTNPDTGATVTETPPPQQPPLTLEEVP